MNDKIHNQGYMYKILELEEQFYSALVESKKATLDV